MTQKILNVLYCSNDGYAKVTATSIVSLFENNQHIDEINIFYLFSDISSSNRSRIDNLISRYYTERQKRTIKWIDSTPTKKLCEELNLDSWYGNHEAWYPLLNYGNIEINTDRLIYIDADTLVLGELDYLFDFDFEDNVIAMCPDFNANEESCLKIGIPFENGYFNSGFSVVNISVFRSGNYSGKIIDYLKSGGYYMSADQDVHNIVFNGKILKLSSQFNFPLFLTEFNTKLYYKLNSRGSQHFTLSKIMPLNEILHAKAGIKIIHGVTNNGKPWWKNSNPHSQKLWRKYINMTDFKDDTAEVRWKSLISKSSRII